MLENVSVKKNAKTVKFHRDTCRFQIPINTLLNLQKNKKKEILENVSVKKNEKNVKFPTLLNRLS